MKLSSLLFDTKWKRAREFESFALCTAPMWLEDEQKREKVFSKISKDNGINLDCNDKEIFENMFNLQFGIFFEALKQTCDNYDKEKGLQSHESESRK